MFLQGGGDVDLWGNRLHSFCIGLPGSPDLKAGSEVAKFLGTDHHEFTFTVQVRCVLRGGQGRGREHSSITV